MNGSVSLLDSPLVDWSDESVNDTDGASSREPINCRIVMRRRGDVRATCRRPARGDAMRRAAATRFSERASSVAFANRRRASRRRASRRCRRWRSWHRLRDGRRRHALDERRAHVHLARGQPFLPFGQHGDGSNDLNFPFGGYKLSGNGRDKSLHALDKYTELKSGCAARCRRAARSERAVQAIAARSEQARLRRVQRVVPMPSACRGPCVVTNVKVDRGAAGTRLLAVVVRRTAERSAMCAAWPFFPVSKIL